MQLYNVLAALLASSVVTAAPAPMVGASFNTTQEDGMMYIQKRDSIKRTDDRKCTRQVGFFNVGPSADLSFQYYQNEKNNLVVNWTYKNHDRVNPKIVDVDYHKQYHRFRKLFKDTRLWGSGMTFTSEVKDWATIYNKGMDFEVTFDKLGTFRYSTDCSNKSQCNEFHLPNVNVAECKSAN